MEAFAPTLKDEGRTSHKEHATSEQAIRRVPKLSKPKVFLVTSVFLSLRRHVVIGNPHELSVM